MPFQLFNEADNEPRQPSGFITELLLVRLTENVGRMPAHLTYELPAYEALRLIHRRKAHAVGTLGTVADLVLDEHDCTEAGL